MISCPFTWSPRDLYTLSHCSRVRFQLGELSVKYTNGCPDRVQGSIDAAGEFRTEKEFIGASGSENRSPWGFSPEPRRQEP